MKAIGEALAFVIGGSVMAVEKKKVNWFVNVALMLGFPLAFAVDWTGLPLHQWFGVLVAMIAAVHLILHWSWCRKVTARLAEALPGKTRACWFLDVGLLAGFIVMLVTGLVISTWFTKVPVRYDLWRDCHIAASYASLGLAAIKMAMKFALARRPIERRSPRESRKPLGVSAHTNNLATGIGGVNVTWAAAPISRRQALLLIGLAGMAVPMGANIFGFEGHPLAQATPTELTPGVKPPLSSESKTDMGLAVPKPQPLQNREAHFLDPDEQAKSIAPATWNSAVSDGPSQTAIPDATVLATAATCTVRCSKQCAYPGQCRRYVDANRNGLCDMGECL